MVSRLEQDHEGTPDSMRKSQVTNLYAELGQKKAISFFSLLGIKTVEVTKNYWWLFICSKFSINQYGDLGALSTIQ